jgi:hypothetical protein
MESEIECKEEKNKYSFLLSDPTRGAIAQICNRSKIFSYSLRDKMFQTFRMPTSMSSR